MKAVTDTRALQGLRTIFNLSVVLYHTSFFAGFMLDHPERVARIFSDTLLSRVLAVSHTLGNASVDIFLLISGFLLGAAAPQPRHALRHLVARWLRLAPVYLMVAALLRASGRVQCIAPAEFMLVTNTVNDSLCVGVGWSTNLDFLSHLFLLPLLWFPSALPVVVALTPLLRLSFWTSIGRRIWPDPVTFIDFTDSVIQKRDYSEQLRLPAGAFDVTHPDLVARRAALQAYYPLYFAFRYRVAAAAIGVLLYRAMRHRTPLYRAVRAAPNLSVLFTAAVWAFYYVQQHNPDTTGSAALLYHAAGRILVTLGTTVVVILACTVHDEPSQAPAARALRALLASPPMLWLSKFSYVIYLMHPLTLSVLGTLPPRLTPDRFTAGWMLLSGFKWYFFTLVITLPVWYFERVCLNARKRILSSLFPNAEKDIAAARTKAE